MAQKTIKDTEFKTVIVTNRDQGVETQHSYVGGNGVFIGGKNTLKSYRFQLGKAISLPVPFIEQLRQRSQVVSVNGGTKSVKLYIIEDA